MNAIPHASPAPARPRGIIAAFGDPRWRGPLLAALNQGPTLVGSLVTMALLTHLVEPATYGRYATLLTLTLFGMQVSHAGWFQFAMKGWNDAGSRHRAWLGFLATTWRDRMPVLLLLVGGSLALAAPGGGFLGWLQVFLLLLVISLGWLLGSVGTAMLNAGEHHGWVLGINLVSAVGRAALPPAFAWWSGGTLMSLLVGLALASTLAIVAAGIACHRVYRPALDVPGTPSHAWRPEIREADWAWPAFGIASWMMETSDRWMMVRFDAVEGGFFALAFAMGMIPFTLAATALHQVFIPRIFRRVKEAGGPTERHALVRLCDRLLLVYLGIGALGAGALAFVVPILLAVGIVGPDYQGAWRWIAWASCAAAFPRLLQFHGLLFQGLGRPRPMVAAAWMLTIAKVVTCGLALTVSETAFMVALVTTTALGAVAGRVFLARRFLALPEFDPPAAR